MTAIGEIIKEQPVVGWKYPAYLNEVVCAGDPCVDQHEWDEAEQDQDHNAWQKKNKIKVEVLSDINREVEESPPPSGSCCSTTTFCQGTFFAQNSPEIEK